MSDVPTDIASTQAQLNLMSASAWDDYAHHRRHVTRLAVEAPHGGPRRLCVLGAGNCNDLDLDTALSAFEVVHLVDLDGDAMSRGIARQRLCTSSRLTPIAGIDLTGVSPWLDRWLCGSATDADVERCRAALQPRASVNLDTCSYGVVISATVLTQMIASAVAALSAEHPLLLALVLDLRDAHLRLIVDLLTDGAIGILVSDVVSSDTCPQLIDHASDSLHDLLNNTLRRHNFFTGTNPWAVAAFLRSDSYLRGRVSGVELKGPWKWSLSPARVHLTYALTFRKSTRRDGKLNPGHGVAA